MDSSIFMEKERTPGESELRITLGEMAQVWNKIKAIVYQKYPEAKEEWNFPGKKYGWSFRIKDKKRAIIYLLPRENYFKVAFVFGQKATNDIMDSTIADEIKKLLQEATVYAEGRGIKIDINDESLISDIEKLVDFKLKY